MHINKNDYLLLSLISAGYICTIFYFATRPIITLFSTIIFAVLYLIWGVFHQARSHNLHAKIVLEYFLVALLGVAIVSTLLL
ncbi:MAG: hypothetical protein WAV40_01410 [Microgenomates group bacterium]